MITFRDKHHKFGGAIAGVRGAIEVLEEQIKELPEEHKASFTKIADVLMRGITRIETQSEDLKAIAYRFIDPNSDIDSISHQIREENSFKKILVVEDDEIMIEIMPKFLQKRGFQVLVSSNVETAKKAIVDEKPAVIVLDLALGESLGGIEILRWIRENNIKSKCIIQTKMDDDDIIKKVESLKPEKILLKPFSLNTLEAQINALMIKAGV